MINTLLIDDEISSCEILEELINFIKPKIKIVGKAHTVNDAVKLIDTLKPKLIFLDIQMPTGTGFDVLEKTTYKDFKVVFVTAHEEYAVKAFKFAAIDYLLKPVIYNDFKDTLAQIETYFENEPKLEAKIDELMQLKQFFTNNKERLILPVGGSLGYKVININDIVRCQSHNNYTEFNFINGEKIISSKTLKSFEGILSGVNFYRIHRSHLINLKYIVGIKKGIVANVQMIDGSEIEISREKKADFFSVIAGL